MKALVLAAGFGTRLKPLTDTMPKPLVPVAGIPMIFYTLALLKKNGIRDIIINLHHLGGKIRKVIGNGKVLGLNIRYSNEPEILGTGGGIRKVLPLLGNVKDLLVINGDVVINADLKSLIKAHKSNPAIATLALREAPEQAQYGLLHYRQGQITSILGKPLPDTKSKTAHFTGLHILKIAPLKQLPLQKQLCVVQDYYVPALKAGQRLNAWVLKGYWSDCGTHTAIAQTAIALNSNVKNFPELKLAKVMAKKTSVK